MSTAYWTTLSKDFSTCRFTVDEVDVQFSVRDVSGQQVCGMFATYPRNTFRATAFLHNERFCEIFTSNGKLEAQTLILREFKRTLTEILAKLPPELNIDT